MVVLVSNETHVTWTPLLAEAVTAGAAARNPAPASAAMKNLAKRCIYYSFLKVGSTFTGVDLPPGEILR
jgi:hypothetical protein